MWNAGLNESQAGIKIAGRNINNLRYADDNSKGRNLLMKVREESEKDGLKLYIQKIKIMTSSHHFMANKRGKVEAMTDFIFFDTKITVEVTAAMILKDAYTLEGKLWQT